MLDSATPSPDATASDRQTRPVMTSRRDTLSFADQRKEDRRAQERNKNNPRNKLTGAARDRFDVIIDTIKRNGIDAAAKGMYLIEATRLAFADECPEKEKLTEREAKQLIRNARSVMFYCVPNSEHKRDKINERFVEMQDETSNPTTTKAVAAFIGAAI